MIFVATKIVSAHIAPVAPSTSVSEIRWDRLMPQLQVDPDTRVLPDRRLWRVRASLSSPAQRVQAHGP
jgi:hypothetical protein